MSFSSQSLERGANFLQGEPKGVEWQISGSNYNVALWAWSQWSPTVASRISAPAFPGWAHPLWWLNVQNLWAEKSGCWKPCKWWSNEQAQAFHSWAFQSDFCRVAYTIGL